MFSWFSCTILLGGGTALGDPWEPSPTLRKGGEPHLLPYTRITCKTCGKSSEDRKFCEMDEMGRILKTDKIEAQSS